MVEQFRLRVKDVELKFLIKTLEDVVEGSDMVLAYEKTLPRNDPGKGDSAKAKAVRC
jgi:hypothetical protein